MRWDGLNCDFEKPREEKMVDSDLTSVPGEASSVARQALGDVDVAQLSQSTEREGSRVCM